MRSGVLLLRADITRLPFPTGSVAAIHAGAAIHCWPNPTIAVRPSAHRLARERGLMPGHQAACSTQPRFTLGLLRPQQLLVCHASAGTGHGVAGGTTVFACSVRMWVPTRAMPRARRWRRSRACCAPAASLSARRS